MSYDLFSTNWESRYCTIKEGLITRKPSLWHNFLLVQKVTPLWEILKLRHKIPNVNLMFSYKDLKLTLDETLKTVITITAPIFFTHPSLSHTNRTIRCHVSLWPQKWFWLSYLIDLLLHLKCFWYTNHRDLSHCAKQSCSEVMVCV